MPQKGPSYFTAKAILPLDCEHMSKDYFVKGFGQGDYRIETLAKLLLMFCPPATKLKIICTELHPDTLYIYASNTVHQNVLFYIPVSFSKSNILMGIYLYIFLIHPQSP